MKRIIDGVTYNTDTSTKLAESEYDVPYNHDDCPCIATLYQTRGGAYFIHQRIQVGVDQELGVEATRDRFVALSIEEAQKWIMEGDTEIFHNPFADPPEAEAEVEPGATIYIRVPSSLKGRVDAAAEEANLSTNALAIRCMEKCIGLNKRLSNAIALIEEADEFLGGRERTNRVREALTILKEIRAQ
jgi:predicted HicB family RNase H-like nuclease